MAYIPKYRKELFWLERRVHWIKLLDSLFEADADEGVTFSAPSHYKEVESPNDLVNRLRDVYGMDLIP